MAINKVAILGSGVMGGGIAAHLANAGKEVLLFDMNQEMVEKGLEVQKTIKPKAFFKPKNASKIQLHTYENLEPLKDCDWICEVIVERLDIKVSLYEKIAPFLKDNAILSSNTSGLSLKAMSEPLSESQKKRFFITHFFNPPRYLKLVETVHLEDYDEGAYTELSNFLQNDLGKGVVEAFDTPNFIANRIGVFSMLSTINLALEMNLPVTQVDQLTGTIIGHPKSATFRTADVVGLDTMAHVARNSHENLKDDPYRDTFIAPKALDQMLEKGLLGSKVKSGFYKKEGKAILELNLGSLEYQAGSKGKWPSFAKAKKLTDLTKRFPIFAEAEDEGGKFIHKLNLATIAYSAYCLGNISSTVEELDNGLKWGFAWKMGPFEIWDAIGFKKGLDDMRAAGFDLPEWVDNVEDPENFKFYRGENCFQAHIGEERPKKSIPGFINLDTKEVVAKNGSASLVDIGDGVLCLKFHSALKPDMNPIDDDIIKMQHKALEIIPGNYKGLVVGHQSDHFSAGANLLLILMASRQKAWDQISNMVSSFQIANLNLKYAPFPVISCPFNLTLGGGYEAAAGADKIFAHAETYMGLVEVGVGLIPAGGGCFQLLNNNYDKARFTGPFPPLQKSFEPIAFAKVSMSGEEGFKNGLLKKGRDQIVMNADQLISSAKAEILRMSDSYETPEKPLLPLAGNDGFLVLEAFVNDMIQNGTISEHDGLIGKSLAKILTGGEIAKHSRPVTPEEVFELEREVFLSLCGEEKTQARIEHMLMKNKPLRN